MKWLVTLLAVGDGKLVLQKLSTTLAVYYMLPREVHAKTCVRTLIASYASKTSLFHDIVPGSNAIDALIQGLDYKQLILSLWFSKSLIEEATLRITGYPSEIIASTLSRMQFNLPDVVSLIRHCLVVDKGNTTISDDLARVRSEALSCLLVNKLLHAKRFTNQD